MPPLLARVLHGHLVLDVPTDLPEGQVIELVPRAEVTPDEGDDLDAAELAALRAELQASMNESATSQLVSADDLLAELRAIP